MTDVILENALIERLARGLPRSPLQVNGLQESDAELVRLPGTSLVLAVKTDCIVEEIESGLYKDPELIGWMAVTVNASDLAAVGAEPLGIVLAETLPPGTGDEFVGALKLGIGAACERYALPVLGGDTNFSAHMQIGGCAIGLIREGPLITRVGCRPGDRLYASGPLGAGSAFAFAELGSGAREAAPGAGVGGANSAAPFRPVARLAEGAIVRRFGSACMDTSDGVLATLDQLLRLNGVGFRVDRPPEELLTRAALVSARAARVPPWMMLAGPHGEFELVFTVPGPRAAAFEDAAAQAGWLPLVLGDVVAEPGVTLAFDGGRGPLDTGAVRNLFAEVAGDVGRYVEGLLRLRPAAQRISQATTPAGTST
jgi:thiamine-monophosphate kinase